MILENLRMGLASIRRAPLRSLLSTLGVAVGIASVVAVASVTDGLARSVTSEFGEVGAGRILAMWIPPRDQVVRRRNYLSLADGESAFRESPAVRAFDPVLSFQPEVRRREESVRLTASGVGPMHLEVHGAELARGRFLGESDMLRRTRAAVVGARVFDELGGSADPVGEGLLLDGVLFTVVGVLEERERGLFSQGDPNEAVLIPVTTAAERFQGAGNALQLNYLARSMDEVPAAEEQIRSALRRARGLPDNAEDDFQVLAMDALLSSIQGVLIGVIAVGIALGGISLLAGGIGVMNVMLVTVRERSREIGIRKAVGAAHGHLVTQFLIEAVLLSVGGGVVGAGLGAGLRLLAPAFAPSLPIGPPPFYAFVVAFGFALTVGVVFGIYPAVVAARRDAWDSLRDD